MNPLKVAVLGASGIGRNHAKWFVGHGCEIVGFLGSSTDSVAATSAKLAETVGYAPPGFTNLAELLRDSNPDAVCVSTPPELHFEQTKQSLDFGAHVLCEKPLIGDDVRSSVEIVRECHQLVAQADEAGLLLGTQMQYATAARKILELSGAAEGGQPIESWSMEMESKMVRAGRGNEKIWIDLSPHPLSVLQKMGKLEIEWDSVHCQVQELETQVRCDIRFAGQNQPCATQIVVRCNPDRAVPLRRFIINGGCVDYAARKSEGGGFKAYFSGDDGREIEMPDLVDGLIGNFVAACQGREKLIVTGADGAQNVEWQLALLS